MVALAKQAKHVQVIARYEIKRNGHVCYAVKSSKGNDTYCTTLVNGKATGCTCPAHSRCYHMNQLEAIEAKRTTIKVGTRTVSGVTPAHAVVKALRLVAPVRSLSHVRPTDAQQSPQTALVVPQVTTASCKALGRVIQFKVA